MSECLNLQKGTKLRMALDAPVGGSSGFTHVCTFYREVDSCTILISAPLTGGKRMEPDSNQKYLFQYDDSGEQRMFAGFVDDVVKEGFRSYWSVRRVEEQRQFYQRRDERLRVELPVTYLQPTWTADESGTIPNARGATMDISNGGLALQTLRSFCVGDVCIVTLPQLDGNEAGASALEVVGEVCWCRELDKGNRFDFVCGLQLRFSDDEDQKLMLAYVEYVKKRYKL